jgi:hypothetical protein
MRLHQVLTGLAQLRPGARETLPLKRAGERLVMAVLQRSGLRAVGRLVGELKAKGHRFQLMEKGHGRRAWREELAAGSRIFELRVTATTVLRSTSLHYLAVRNLRLTPAQQQAHALQSVFYDRYMEIGRRAYRPRAPRLAPLEQRILLVGELEADVNNGGFSQYLDNKGRRRARAALAALKAIGARKTAAMLAKAMAQRVTEAELAALDDKFYKAPEDLALLAARHAGLDA